MPFFSWLHAFAVCFPRQRASGTVFGHPTLGGLIIQKIKAQNAEVNRSPFRVIRTSGEIPPANSTLPAKEGAIFDLDSSKRPPVIG
jgi:hypothetical protein